jgi:hypothetical protein
MYEAAKKRYKFSDWSKDRSGNSMLLKGFAPWRQDFPGWEQISKESFGNAYQSHLTRTLWESMANKKARVLIDVYETANHFQACEKLICILNNNQLALLPEGPSDLADVSFVHPENQPPAIFMVRGNICLNLYSFGEVAVALLTWAYQFDTRINDMPEAEHSTQKLSLTGYWVEDEQAWRIESSVPSQVEEECYYKFFAVGGELFLKSQELYFLPRQGNGTIKGFAIGPNRIPYGGGLVLRGDAPLIP